MIYLPQRFVAVIITVMSLSWCATAIVIPTITSLSPASGAPGTTVTIKGANFGSTPGFSKVTFNGIPANPTSWTAGSILVPVPAGVTSGPVIVNINGLPSNSAQFTVSQGLKITSLSPFSGTVGTVVTITGTGFGASQGASSVQFGFLNATPTSWSNTTIIVAIPAGATTGLLTVTVGGASALAGRFSIVSGPAISSLSPASAAIGSSIKVIGSNFGSTQTFSTVTFNGIAATPASWTAGSILVPVPAGATSGPVVVNVNGVASNGVQFTVPQHFQITSLSQTSGAIGASITINGSGFGVTQGWSSVTFNRTPATPISWSDSAITVPVPTGATTTGSLAVTVGGTTASASFTVVSGPVLSGLSPALAAAGTPVTITGSGFGPTQGSSMVKFNGVTATPTGWSSSSIVVSVPSGALTGPVTVTVAGIQSAGAMFVAVSSGGPYAYSLAAGNFDNNSNPGLAIINRCLSTTNCSSGSVGIMLGNGNGTFKPAVTYSSGGIESLAAAVGDFNNDGIQDLAVLNSCATSACTNGSVSVLLGNGYGTFRSPLNSSAGGYQSTGIAMGDLNGDHIPDLVIANNCADSSCASGGTITVLIGKGDGTFKPPVSYASGGQGAFSIVVGDFNRDGIPDVAVVNDCATTGCSSGSVGILLGNGDGTFKPAVTYPSGGQGAYSLASADFNDDGYADLAVVNNCANGACSNGGAVGVLLGNGDGTFQAPIVSNSGGLFAYSLAVADFNLDRHADLAVTNEYGGTSNGGTVSVLLGNGDGTFQAAANYDSDGTNPFSVVAADFNTFGGTGLAVANSCLPAFNCAEGAITILSGNGDGTFGSAASYAALTAGGQSGTLAPPHHQVSLSWNAVVSVNGYNVYRGSQSGGPYTKINPIVDASPSFVDLSVLAGQTYYYVTTAVNAGVESGYSNEVEASIPSP